MQDLTTPEIEKHHSFAHFPFSRIILQSCWQKPKTRNSSKQNEKTNSLQTTEILSPLIEKKWFLSEMEFWWNSKGYNGTFAVCRSSERDQTDKSSNESNKKLKVAANFSIHARIHWKIIQFCSANQEIQRKQEIHWKIVSEVNENKKKHIT